MKNLLDIGERNIVQDIIYDIFPYLKDCHDDTVNISINACSSIVLSTDPCPEPIICSYDPDNTYYYWGWMSVLINYSDLAAEGATPIGVLLSTIMPNEMKESDYKKFLLGVKDACDTWGGHLLGGNVKDGPIFSVTGTAVGKQQEKGRLLHRRGMQPGDSICVVGEMGIFGLGIMQLLDGCSLSDMDKFTQSYIVAPYPKLREGVLLAKSSMVTSCMDSSDGIIGCLYELATLNNVSIHIVDSMLTPNEKLRVYCKQKEVDYRNLMLSFGGWELVFSCRRSDVKKLEELFSENGMSFSVIGYVGSLSNNRVLLHKEDKIYEINDFSSKRFDKTSMFSFGLKPIMDQFYKPQIKFLAHDK